METLLYSCDEGVATITLNRPEARNAIGATMTAELDALLQQRLSDRHATFDVTNDDCAI